MDDISFELAPVVELIAELRWNPPGVMVGGDGAPNLTLAGGRETEEFFLHFGAAVANHGYTQSEKIVPQGLPAAGILHQVSWRFRKPGDASSLFQIGPGLFSANALQPYRRWSDFRPTVIAGISALLATRIANEKATPFANVSLRYVNAFTGVLLGGKSPAEFTADMLGVKLSLPEPISRLIEPKRPVSSNANFLIPVTNTSKVMAVAVGDGLVNSEPAALYDVTVADKNVASSAVDVMTALDGSRNIIHTCFVDLSKPFADRMKPIGGKRAS